MSTPARIYIGIVIGVGVAILAASALSWHSENIFRFITYLILAALSGGLKIRLPGVTGTLSGGFLIAMLSVARLSAPETVAIAIISVLTQYVWQSSVKLRLVQAAFNICNAAIAAWAASVTLHSQVLEGIGLQHPLRLVVAAMVYFAGNCFIVAVVIALTENKPYRQIIQDYFLWSAPFYLLAAALVEAMGELERVAGWQASILVIPAVYAFYQIWAVFADKVEGERKRQEQARLHAEQMSALHVRTIHALAMAIEARDRTTHDHLRRVQIYAVEIGREMGLKPAELEALRTAAVLHDIGKLGVPEHIISKPGRLTPEEFEKVQAHPVVGAEILERVDFPFGVVPIVRCHHERWNGTGYPDGLKGTDIPIGARILSVVDCFDALASDRQYRKAMKAEDAIQVVRNAANKDFDPEVVEQLASRYNELEQLVRKAAADEPPMLTRQEIREAVPAAGFQSALVAGRRTYSFAEVLGSASIAHSRVTSDRRDLSRALAEADKKLRPALGYEFMALYIRENTSIRLHYLTDHSVPADTALIPVGKGLSGWIVEEGRPILNGNGRLDNTVGALTGRTNLMSGSSVPIQAGDRTIGALTVYSADNDAFAARDVQLLWALSAEIGAWLLESSALPETEIAETFTPAVPARAV